MLIGGLLHRVKAMLRVGADAPDFDREDRRRFIGLHLHRRHGQLRLIPHPLDLELRLAVSRRTLRVHLEFWQLRFGFLRLLVERLRELLHHLPRLLELLLELLWCRLSRLLLQGRREQLLHTRRRFQMSWEVAELQVNIAQNREELWLRLEEVA
jgi:hypothetical protein